MNYKELIENALGESQLNGLPEELQPEHIHIWKGDIDTERDWDDFIGGQLVNHVYFKKSIRVGIDIEALEYGSSETSFYSMFENNTTMELYTSEAIDLTGSYITVGNSNKMFFAISHSLYNFSLKEDKTNKPFLTKIVLVDVVKYLSDRLDEGTPAPTINIEIGKIGEIVSIPKANIPYGSAYDPNAVKWGKEEIINDIPDSIEVFFPEPTAIIGLDFTSNTDGTVKTDKRIVPNNANLRPKNFPINEYYSILPTQWQIPSLDNYGFTHPADTSNALKALLASQSIGNVTNTGVSASGVSGAIGSILSAGVSLGGKFFGDKGTLANSLAVNPKFTKSDADGLKMFIQGDGANSYILDKDGYLQLGLLKMQNDYIETNQANGEFGKYGKPMSPSQNNEFNDTTHWRGLGLDSVRMNKNKIPALATPFADGAYAGLKITDTKIKDFLLWGVPRQEAKMGDILSPMLFPETWDVYIRNMFFRPDPYSFWNWPVLYPAEIGAYNVEKLTSISYDYTSAAINVGDKAIGIVNSIKETLQMGTINTASTPNQRKKSYWNKTVTLEQFTNNDLYDPNKTFTSIRFEFDKGKLDNLYQAQLSAFSASVFEIKLIKGDKVIRHHKFNTQGRNVGTASSYGTVVQF